MAHAASALAGREIIGLTGLSVWAIVVAGFCLLRLRGASRSPAHVAEMIVTSALIPLLSAFWRVRGGWRFRVWFC